VLPEDKAQVKNLSDEQISAMLKGDKPRKRDPDAPSPRMPEALYFYALVLFQAAVLQGVWGYMLRGIKEVVTRGPREDATFWEHARFNLVSTFEGLGDQVIARPWLSIGIAFGACAIFVPRTERGRKRMATLVTGLIVACFASLIALQFMADLGTASSHSVY